VAWICVPKVYTKLRRAILLDGYLRYDKVNNMHKQKNPHWKREAVIQSAGFAGGILAGAGIVFLIGAAPLGLVVGIVAAGVAAVVADKLATGIITNVYDL
jgi:F0F1-type ATP synthase assembly protein I